MLRGPVPARAQRRPRAKPTTRSRAARANNRSFPGTFAGTSRGPGTEHVVRRSVSSPRAEKDRHSVGAGAGGPAGPAVPAVVNWSQQIQRGRAGPAGLINGRAEPPEGEFHPRARILTL